MPSTGTTQQLAIVFSDVSRSSRLYEQYGDSEGLRIVGRAMEVMAAEVKRTTGTVLRTLGDEVFSTFPEAVAAVEAAVAMHRAVRDDAQLKRYALELRIGLHYGDAIWERSEVYGDAVNLAARMARLAQAGQVLTTQQTIQAMPPYLRSKARSLGRIRVEGRMEEVELYEVIWQEDTSDLTIVPGQAEPTPSLTRASIILRYGEREYLIERGAPAFHIGRGAQNDLVVDEALVSRNHAVIEYRQGKFLLTDSSTNGTYVRIEPGDKFYVHREAFPMHGEGHLSLGKHITAEHDGHLYFRCQ